jgi:hypothetical protein
MAISYQEILARREKRKHQELEFAMRRPKIPKGSPIALQIMILQWAMDELYAGWRASEIAKAQASKKVLKPGRVPGKRGGRRSSVLEQLGIK